MSEKYVVDSLGDKCPVPVVKAKKALELVKNCKRNCAFIVTERHDMVRRPWIPIKWIIKNKLRIRQGKDICWD